MSGVGERADGILDGMGRGRTGHAEGKAGERRTEHDLFAGGPIGAILAGRFEPLPEKTDGAQRKLIGQRILADEHTLQRNAGNRVAPDRGEGLDGVGQRIRTGNRGQTRWAGEGQFGIADRHGRDEIGAGNAHLQAALGIR